MKNYFTLLLLFLTMGLSYSQGSETFENICTSSCTPASSSYGTRIWNGQDGSIWTATNSRTDQTIVNAEAICMNDDVANTYIESGTIAGGVGSLTLTTQRKFSGGSSFVDVLINGSSIGTAPVGTDPQTTTFVNVNVSGNFVIRINNNIGGSNGGGQDRVAIDDITWTGFVLPVELINFKIRKNHLSNLLTWITLNEINNHYFEIMRSSDGLNFQTIGRIEGNGNSSREIKYSFIDNNPFFGFNYYKLKQVDFNGAFEYSDIAKIENKSNNVKVYPTNILDVLNIEIENTESAKLTILNNAGQIFKVASLTSTFNSIEISDLPSGMYIAKVESNTQIFIERIVKY